MTIPTILIIVGIVIMIAALAARRGSGTRITTIEQRHVERDQEDTDA